MLILLAGLCLSAAAQSGEWAWMGGSDTVNQPGVYGTKGTPAPKNIPGGRGGAATWTDLSGHLWLFGTYGANDLWEFNPSTNAWAWMGGSSTGGLGVYGTKGKPAAGNIPGGRGGVMNWTDLSGNLWLFGGGGVSSYGSSTDYWTLLNDLWEFNPSLGVTGEWTWMGGNSTVPSSGVQPGVYGTLGTPAPGNIPGGRIAAVNWTDSSGHFWLFGGMGYDAYGNSDDQLSNGITNYLNDLWQYNPSTNQWTWMGGSKIASQPGTYGTLGVPAAGNIPGGRIDEASWADSSGHFWLFGGSGFDANGDYGYLNDLWEFTPSTRQWAWMGGSKTVPCYLCGNPGVYGTLGTPAAANTPGSRFAMRSLTWTDSTGHLWLLGGEGFDASGDHSELNDLWEFNPSTKQWAWMGGSSTVGSNGGQPGVYGALGTPAAGNIPGGRASAASWTDHSGNLWLFGGRGFDADGNNGSLNDLWKYQPSTASLPHAATPTFSLPTGSYTGTQTVRIGDATNGPTIYYTTNGTAPTTSSNLYSGPLTVSSTDTVKAIATASGCLPSTVATATYTIKLKAAAPAFSPAVGASHAAHSVTLTDATKGAAIYYTTNGKAPTTASPRYKTPIQVSQTTTIKAIAVVSGYTDSVVASGTYTIK